MHPFVALGRELVSRGHSVRLAMNAASSHKLEGTGVEHVALGERWELSELGDHPDLLHPRRGPEVVFGDLVLPRVAEIYGVAREQVDSWRPHVVASHHIAMGVPWACRERASAVPWVSVLLSPLSWVSRADPNVYPRVLPRFLRGFEAGLLPRFARWRGDKPVNAIRAGLGLAPGRDHLFGHATTADLHLGLWSPQLRGPTVDDPPRSHVTGFCLHDRDARAEAPAIELERALAGSGSGAPILVGIGTAAVHIDRDFFGLMGRAAALLPGRGIRNPMLLLTGEGVDPPAGLPSNVTCLAYAPFSTAMPRCAMSIVHGGAGSTGQAMRSGRPFAVVPFCNDQFDFAARAVRLKCARSVPREKLTPEAIASVICETLTDPVIHERAERVAYLESLVDGPARAAEQLERIARRDEPASTLGRGSR